MKFHSHILNLGFQIFLYRGSQVPSKNYVPLMDALRNRLSDRNVTIAEKDYSFFRRNQFHDDDALIIGHSFGGYFGLLDALHDQETQKRVAGVVLLRSHFNSRGASWYPGVSQKDVSAPVLTIAGGLDRRLPIQKVLPDLWEKLDENIPDRPYKIYPNHDHFSGVNGTWGADVEELARDIEAFARKILEKRSATVFMERLQGSERPFLYDRIENKIPRSIDYNQSLNFLDALFMIILKRFFWMWVHHVLFLLETPTQTKNVVFTDYGDHILIKSYHLQLDEVLRICRNCLPATYPSRFEVLTLPTNVLGLYQWLLCPLILRAGIEEGGTLRWPILRLPVRENVVYYKILHPRQLILKHVETWK